MVLTRPRILCRKEASSQILARSTLDVGGSSVHIVELVGLVVELVVELVVFYVELVELVETENDCSLQSFFVLTSSTSFVTPVIKVDKKLINNGKIGHITLKLADLYLKSVIR